MTSSNRMRKAAIAIVVTLVAVLGILLLLRTTASSDEGSAAGNASSASALPSDTTEGSQPSDAGTPAPTPSEEGTPDPTTSTPTPGTSSTPDSSTPSPSDPSGGAGTGDLESESAALPVAARSGSRQALLNWTAPDGGVVTLRVAVAGTDNWVEVTGKGTGPSARALSGLTNGVRYAVSVTWSSPGRPDRVGVVHVTPRDVPAGVDDLRAAAVASGELAATWLAPEDDGGARITRYDAAWAPSSSGPFTSLGQVAETVLVAPSVPDTARVLRVRAVNEAGPGPWTSAAVTRAGAGDSQELKKPGQVPGLTASAGDQAVSLSWQLPAEGGVADSYEVSVRSVGGDWERAASSTSPRARVTGLTNGVTYEFRVAARNAVGRGSWSAPVTAIPAPVPDGVGGVSVEVADSAVSLSWVAPANGKAVPTLRYEIAWSSSGELGKASARDGKNTLVTSDTRATVSGLVNGVAYEFQVRALSDSGQSPWTPAGTVVTYGLPGPPAGVATAVAGADVELSWGAPVSSGGAAVSEYVVERLDGTGTWVPAGRSGGRTLTVTGLTAGTDHEFRVAAVNKAGQGPYAATVTARTPGTTQTASTAPTIPSAPGTLVVTPSSGQLDVTWTAPANGGSAITDYTLEYRIGVGAWSTFADGVSALTGATVTGLSNGTAYELRVAATNQVGVSAWSTVVTGTPSTVPDAPTALAGTPGDGQVALTWTAPASDGGGALTDYLVEYRAGVGAWTTFTDGVSTGTSATITGLTNGTAYELRLSAVNLAGTGASSGTVTQTPYTVPNAPTALAGTDGSTQVALTWTAPASDGGRAITDYVVEYRIGVGAWSTFADGVSTTPSATVTGLTNGTTYELRVSAVNIAGSGAVAAVSGTPYTVPNAPTGLAGTDANGQVALTWTAPASNGGRAVTDYVVEYRIGVGAWSTFADGVSTTPSATVTGLTNGTTYELRVSAVNAAGTGSAGTTTSSTPYTVPGAPIALAGTAGDSQVALSWTAPASDGGRAITDYVVEYRIGVGAWTTFTDGVSATTGATVTGLTNGTAYELRVSAVNAAGTGAPGTTTSSTPYTVPNAPTALAGTDGSTQVALAWTAPAFNGGAAITDYVIEYRIGVGAWTTFVDGVSTGTSATVTGLVNGTAYDLRVSAVNAAGTGSAGTAVSSTPYTVPNAPTALAGTDGNSQVALTWTAPASNGGRAVTDYVVEYRIGVGAWTTFADGVSTTPSATVTGLTNGTTYDLRVSAVNAAGAGASSSVVSSTPYTVPDAPTALAGTDGDSQVALTWTAPASNGGRAVTDYVVEYRVGVGAWTTFADGVSTTPSTTVTGLTNGTTYELRVSAVNAAGTGAAGTTATGTPYTVPGAPTALAGTDGSTQVALTWTAPASNGGRAITDYLIEYRVGVGAWTTFADGTSTGTAATVTGLTNGTAYELRVSAVNAAGTGTVSGSTTGTPYTVPDAPTALAGTDGSTQVALTWTAPAFDGGRAVTDYVVEYRIGVGAWTTFADGVSTTPSTTVTGLTNGTAYELRVSAVNAAGTGAAGTTATGTPYTTPDNVGSLAGTDGSTQVALTWIAPAFNGGRAVTDYVIEYRVGVGAWATFADGVSTTPSATVTGLTNGTTYDLRVTAVNAAGSSAGAIITGTPYTTPDNVGALAGTDGSTQVALTWTAPAFNGGRAVTDYVVEYRVGVGAWTTFADGVSTTPNATVTGLVNDTTYDVRVTAVNAAGASAGAIIMATPYTVPGAPTGLAGTPGDTQVALSWTAPASNGGRAVTDYVIEYRIGVGAWTTFTDGTSATTSATVTGLTNGTAYELRVSAVNAAGAGPVSGTTTSTPRTVPSNVGSLAATSGDTQLALTWTAPISDGGDAITDYVIEYRIGVGAWSTFTDGVSAVTGATVTGLVNGTTYGVRVTAVNAAGSSAGAIVLATPYTIPGAPTGLAATSGNTQLALAWTAPASDGGDAITDYVVEYRIGVGAWSSFTDGTSATTSATVTGLANGTTYELRVSAVNAAGAGATGTTTTGTPYTVPGAPTGLAGTDGNGQVALTWTAPASNGGAAVSDYLVEYRIGVGAWTPFADGTSTGTSATVTGLANGTTYELRVSAVNAAGTGAPGTTTTGAPYTVPNAPTGLAGTDGSTQVALTWTAPAFDGGRPITDYVVEYRIGVGAWSTFTDGVGTGTSATVTGLSNGTTYELRVSAVNAAGTGTAGTTTSGTPYTVPNAPTALAGTDGDSQVALTWTAPVFDGGRAVTDYVVEYRVGVGAWTTFTDAVSATASATVTGLTNGTTYELRVSAVNAAGTGAVSSTTTGTPYTVPGAPTGLAGTDGSTQVALAWTAPAVNGGRAITDYVVEYRIGVGAWTTFADGVGTGTSATVTGLTNGTTYELRVSAVNAAGTGTASSTTTGTPYTVPNAPTAITGTGGNQQVGLTWTAPAFDGGRAITDYVVEYRIGVGAWSTFTDGVSATASATVTGLTNGTTYELRVSAVNAAGTGTAGTSTSTTPYTVPDAPTALGATAGNAQVALTWTAPVFDGGSAVLSYTVTAAPGGNTCTATAPTLTCTVTGLTNDTAYTFTAQAVNAAGASSASSSASATPYVPYNAATGGTVTDVTNYNGTGQTWRVHTFTAGSTLTVTSAPNPFSYLVLGGGGGGHHGNDWVYGGNGGGGGLLTGTTTLSVSSYPITVAAGGAVNNDAPNSTFNGLTARGGGAGGFGGIGSIGGSGGGGQGFTSPTGGGAGVAGQGYAGGTGASSGYGGGGGGAGGAGGTGGTPGPGVFSTITGTSYEYGRGGAPNTNPTLYGQGGWGSGCCGQQPVAGYQGIVVIAYQIG